MYSALARGTLWMTLQLGAANEAVYGNQPSVRMPAALKYATSGQYLVWCKIGLM